MPANKSKNKLNTSWKKALIASSIALNVVFVTFFIIITVSYSTGVLDFSILNFALGLKFINYDGPGGCLQISSKYADGTFKVDAKGRVISGDGKVQCIVQITPQEADAIQQKFDSENVGPPKQ